jgi:branched-chain amino acid transport system permease protein
MGMIGPTVILQALVSGVLIGSIYGLVGMGFTLIYGVMEVVNFSHGHLVMAGMFGCYVLFQQFGLDPLLSIPLAVAVGYVAGLLLYQVLVRHVVAAPQFAQVILTLALFIFLENGANFLFGGDLRAVRTSYTAAAWRLGGVAVSIPRLAGAAVALAATLGVQFFLRSTLFGKAVRAAANNRDGASLVGIEVASVFRNTFALSVAAACLAGAVLTPFYLVSPFVGNELLLKAFVVMVAGGMGNVVGAWLSGVIMGVVEAFAAVFVTASLVNAIVFAMLIVILLVRPTGLFAAQARVRPGRKTPAGTIK